MKAVIYHAFGATPQVTSVPDPGPTADGVVVRVEASGVCRSDWHGWRGHDPDIVVPHVPGHELAGEVVAVGADVRTWQVGDRVTTPFVLGCGHCAECRAGDQQVCRDQFQPGFTQWGSFAEYVSLPRAEANLVALPDGLGFAGAAGLGCRFATAFRAVVDQGRVRGGEWVVVHGCGGVGLSAILIATALGAQVVAVDVNPAALQRARELGAVAVVDSRTGDVPAAVAELTGGGAHVSIDALGHPDVLRDAILGLRRRGRHVQVGLFGAQESPRVPMARVIGYELEVLGSHGMAAHRYDAMLAMIASGQLRPELLLGAQISLEESVSALTSMDTAPGVGATVITRF